MKKESRPVKAAAAAFAGWHDATTTNCSWRPWACRRSGLRWGRGESRHGAAHPATTLTATTSETSEIWILNAIRPRCWLSCLWNNTWECFCFNFWVWHGNFLWLWHFSKKCRYIESKFRKKNYFGINRKCHYSKIDVIEMTLYRSFFYKDKERKKSEPTKNCHYSKFDVILSVIIEGFDCIQFLCLFFVFHHLNLCKILL